MFDVMEEMKMVWRRARRMGSEEIEGGKAEHARRGQYRIYIPRAGLGRSLLAC